MKVKNLITLVILVIVSLSIGGCSEEDKVMCTKHDDRTWRFTDLTFTIEKSREVCNVAANGDTIFFQADFIFKSNDMYEGDKLTFRLGEEFIIPERNSTDLIDEYYKPLKRDAAFMINLLCENRKIPGTKKFELVSVGAVSLHSKSVYECADTPFFVYIKGTVR